MSDIQRWAPFDPMALMGRHPNGAFVTYADHVAAVKKARAEGDVAARVGMAIDLELVLCGEKVPSPNGIYERIFEAGVKAAREAVAAHIRADLTGQEMFCGRKRGILAAIDALRGGS